MKIPPSIWIGGKRFKIVLRKNLGKKLGVVDYDNRKILLQSPHPDIKNTIIHECLHIVESFFRISLSEKDVDRLANGIRMLFVDNPNLLKLLEED